MVLLWAKKTGSAQVEFKDIDMSGNMDVLDIANVASIAEVSSSRKLKFDLILRIVLQMITGAKSLKLCSWFALVFSLWQLTNLPSPSFSCKSLHLQLDFVKWHLPGILNLLRHCPCLENLIVKLTSYAESTFQNILSSMVDAPVQCLTHHLKTVEVAGLVMEKQRVGYCTSTNC
ncbi:hypothetical protein P3S68_004550 [Capsicum galapagoense]